MNLHERSHTIFTVFIIGSLVLSVFLFVQLRTLADVQPPSNPDNNAPTATIVEIVTGDGTASTTVSTGSPLNLVGGATVPVHVVSTFVDYDGCSEVTSGGAVYGLLMRDQTESVCVEDGVPISDSGRGCYAADSCVVTSCEGQNATVQCTFNVSYNADATSIGELSDYDWYAYIVPLDETMLSTGSTAQDSPGIASSTFDIAPHVAVDVASEIAFGEVALGTLSSEQQLQINNVGNQNLNEIGVTAQPLICTALGGVEGEGGIIPESNLLVSNISEMGSEDMLPLSSSTDERRIFDVSVPRDDMGQIFFRLQYPSELVSGTCTGTIAVFVE